MRKNIVVGNWKMNLDLNQGFSLVEDVLQKLSLKENIEVVFASSFIHLDKLGRMCNDISNVNVSAQNCCSSEHGAFTGEISAKMLSSCNTKYVILGHSERRVLFSEDNQLLKLKVQQALAQKISVIFCCGESLEQRNNGVHFEWLKSQIIDSLFHLNEEDFKNIIIAYEPIWAIGTGLTASSDQAQEIHSFIRSIVQNKYGSKVSDNLTILYGGSCNSSNAAELFFKLDIDGGLIGGASLVADDFLAIINSF